MRIPLEIAAIVADLAAIAPPRDAVNMYAADGPPGNALRRHNLALALTLALARGPDLLIRRIRPVRNSSSTSATTAF